MTKRIIALLLVVACMVGIVGSAMAASSRVSMMDGSGKCKHLYWRYKTTEYKYYHTVYDGLLVRARYVYEIDACTKCGATKRIFVDNQWYDVDDARWRSNW